MKFVDAATALHQLERTVIAVTGRGADDSNIARALTTLQTLAQKEGIPLAIVGGLAAIRHGYERFTKDIDVVVRGPNLAVLIQVAPRYGIKVIWKDPDGWHKLQCEGIPIDVVPEGRRPRKDAPTRIPTPEHLGVSEGADYASVAGWIETKLGSFRVQDQADIVQVIKVTSAADLRTIRTHLTGVHPVYVQRFDDLYAAAKGEVEEERRHGGGAENPELPDI